MLDVVAETVVDLPLPVQAMAVHEVLSLPRAG